MTVRNVARSRGSHHDSAQERLSAGRASVAARAQWLHWIDKAESLEPWADGEWAPTPRDDGSTTSAASWVTPALPDCVGPLRRRLAALAATHTENATFLGDLRLATSEAITNAVIHAYRDRDEPGTVTVAISIAAGVVDVVVTDGGVGMSPRPDSPGAGLGLTLMAALCDQLIIRPGPTGKGTEVRMVLAMRCASLS